MGRNTSPIFERGATQSDSYVANHKIAGQVGVYIDEDGQELVMRVVKNNSGGALLPRKLVKYDADYIGTQVDGVSTATARPVGAVDQDLPAAGVADGDWFLIAIEGRHDTISGAAITVGDNLVSDAAGASKTAGSTPTYFNVGRAEEVAAGASVNIKTLLGFIN